MVDDGIVEPSRWRRRHGQVERLEAPIKDANDEISRPWRGYDTLAKMQGMGSISGAQREAGDRFHDAFRRAGFDGLQAADPGRAPVLTMGGNAHLWARERNNEEAYWVVSSAIDALGGIYQPCGSCAWHVLGLEEPLKEWCLHWAWGRRGQINVQVATGILIGGLGLLELHWGLRRR